MEDNVMDNGTVESSTVEGSTGKIRFAVIGSGWRSDFFLRVARKLPARFEVCGMVTRSADTARAVEEAWNVPGYPTIRELAAQHRPDFVVVSVPRTVAPGLIAECVELGLPVLTETPPAEDVAGLLPLHRLVADGAVIQVAEQYHLSPLLNAQLAIARSGKLGTISQALVAQCHDYHGVSLLRRALGIGYEDAVITASAFSYPVIKGPTRGGEPTVEQSVLTEQITGRLDFGDRLGVYEFAPEQYRSWIRANRLLIRGDRGEIKEEEIRYLKDFRTPMIHTIRRVSTGEGGYLDGHYLRGLIAGDDWVFLNEFAPGDLNDDEIALATCLTRMREHIGGGPELYSLAEASQDLYLALLIKQAAATGETIRTTSQPWSRG